MKHIKIILLLFLVSASFYSCSRYSTATGPEVQTTETKLKVINTATNFPSLSAKIDNNSIHTLAFESSMPYQTLTDGLHKMLVRTPMGLDSMHHENNLTDNVAYTWFILDGSPLYVIPAVDDLRTPANGKAKVRVSNFSNVDTIDIKITNADNLITGVNNGAVWGYTVVNNGTYDLEVRNHSTNALLYSATGVTFSNQAIYDLVVTGHSEGTGQKEIRFTVYN